MAWDEIVRLIFSLYSSCLLWLQRFDNLIFSIGIGFGLLTLVVLVAYLLIKAYLSLKDLQSLPVYFEVQPLSVTEQSTFTTSQLFTALHGLGQQTPYLYRLFKIRKRFSLEIVSTKDAGIRYMLMVPKEDAALIKKNLIAFLPGVSVKKIDDYLPVPLPVQNTDVSEIKLSGHFAFPLHAQNKLDEYDPIGYLTGMMTKLDEDELVAMQLVMTPFDASSNRDIRTINRALEGNRNVIETIRNLRSGVAESPLRFLELLFQILFLPMGILVFVLTDGREGPLLKHTRQKYETDESNVYRNEVEGRIKAKIDQHLFTATFRLLIATGNRQSRHRKA